MHESLLVGMGRFMLPLARPLWQSHVRRDAHATQARLDFMTTAHHQVRDLAVIELPRTGHPLPPERIAWHLGLELGHVERILRELEENLTFLYRNEQGAVAWAYPVTVDPTPHRLAFSTGERIYAA
jgi:hypothetical protein